MIIEQRIRDKTFLVFTTVLLVILYLKVAAHQGLALDGSAGMLHLVNTEEVKFIRGREFEEFVNQIGTVLLLKSNVLVSMQLLSYVLGVSVFGIPTAIWIYTLRLSINESFKFLMIFLLSSYRFFFQVIFSTIDASQRSWTVNCCTRIFQQATNKNPNYIVYSFVCFFGTPL